mmetsp:Transcript_11199/g.19647  ORF Transcript_11199/g.19647 Transcript_11199/m.19647 type:complete len:274 (-) Transcript_11199:51-872(-)
MQQLYPFPNSTYPVCNRALRLLGSFSSVDATLALLLLVLCVDVRRPCYNQCQRPVHMWVLGSCALVILARVAQLLTAPATAAAAADSKKTWQLVQFSAFAGLSMWIVMGTVWSLSVRWHTPHCLPGRTHWWLLLGWQGVGYMWILSTTWIGFLAKLNEWRLLGLKTDLQAIEDADMLERWGDISSHPRGVVDFTVGPQHVGLRPAEIAALPCSVTQRSSSEANEDLECSICLCSFKLGDRVRRLDRCGHVFHRPCLDLWLLRCASCPLCKSEV